MIASKSLPYLLIIYVSYFFAARFLIAHFELTCRYCTTYRRPVAMGEHDHGYIRSLGLSDRAT